MPSGQETDRVLQLLEHVASEKTHLRYDLLPVEWDVN